MKKQAILLGVPKVEYGADGITPFPRCLKACADYLGLDVGCDYCMAASGAAFRLTWDSTGWNPGNVDVIHSFDDPSAVYWQGLAALGCEYRLLGRTPKMKKAEFVSFIRESIDAGYPCIALGIIGPPEACIITGYRDNGNTLLGWNFFQDNPEFARKLKFDESGYFITDDWWKNPETKAVMALTKGGAARPAPKMILQNAMTVLTGRQCGQYAKGIHAYDAWAAAILNDSEFPPNAMLAILAERLMTHGDAQDCLMDGRHSAASWLKSLIPAYPAQEAQLTEAAALFTQVFESAQQMNEVLGGWQRDENAMRRLADPEARKQLAVLILKAKAADERALELLKKLAELL